MTSLTRSRKALRQELRALRRSLSAYQQAQAAEKLCRRLRSQPVFLRSRHIAVYLPNDGEIDPALLVKTAWSLGKRCFLPVLNPQRSGYLSFAEYTMQTRLTPNRFGIPEPDIQPHQCLPAPQLDLVLMPLVGFDQDGGRLGMGGGFYDRTFAFRHSQATTKPCLLGLAHHGQQVSSLPIEPWDVPLNAIVTDKSLIIGQEPSRSRNFLPGIHKV